MKAGWIVPTVFLLLAYWTQHANAMTCGKVRVCVRRLPSGSHRFKIKITKTAILGTLTDVDASGYFYNWASGTNGVLAHPGDDPNLAASTFTDRWTGTPGYGPVEVGFPFIRVYDSPTNFCYANFKKLFSLSAVGPKTRCFNRKLFHNRKVDFALIVDTTGSMGDDIGEVKTKSTNIINALDDISTSFRGGLVTYNDYVPLGTPDASIVQPFTSDVTTLTDAIEDISVSGGGDYEECVYEGILLALGLNWQTNSRRIMIVMGDAPAKECTPLGTTLSDVLSASYLENIVIDPSPSVRTIMETQSTDGLLTTRQAEGNITLSLPVKRFNPLYMIATNSGAKESFAKLAEDTGGLVLDADSSNVTDVIVDVIGSGKTTKDLKVSLVCPPKTSYPRVRIKNSNSFPVEYSWKEVLSSTRGRRTARIGKSFLNLRRSTGGSISLTITWKKKEGGEDGSVVLTTVVCVPT